MHLRYVTAVNFRYTGWRERILNKPTGRTLQRTGEERRGLTRDGKDGGAASDLFRLVPGAENIVLCQERVKVRIRGQCGHLRGNSPLRQRLKPRPFPVRARIA